jgi:hypothetical protein
MLTRLSTLLLVATPILLASACASDPAGDPKENPPGSLGTPAVVAACKKPESGTYMAKLTPKGSCPWWTNPEKTSETMNFSEDDVHYPFTDDVCGEVSWEGCTVRDDCGPIKLNAGGTGYFAKGKLVATFTDDTHANGSIVFDVGQACKVEFDFTAQRLRLGGR